jgi:hypothetical protein
MITRRRSPTGHFIIDELLNNFNVNEKETVNDKLTFECLSCPIASTEFNTKKKWLQKERINSSVTFRQILNFEAEGSGLVFYDEKTRSKTSLMHCPFKKHSAGEICLMIYNNLAQATFRNVVSNMFDHIMLNLGSI